MKPKSKLKIISLIVIFFHLVPISVAYLLPKKPQDKKSTPMVIRTVVKAPVSITSKPQQLATKNVRNQTKKETIPTPKVKKEIKKPIDPKATIQAKKKPPSLSSEELAIPHLKSPENIKNENSSDPKENLNMVFEILESLISLPKKGMIKAQINIQENGEIDTIKIIDNDHPENERYLIETLKGFKLPLENHFKEKKELIVIFRGI